ncbi:MAG: TRAP transporter small permease [Roseovarius sp.]|nr:TRAP transporter small permease [Roseovarius sp.]MCY4291229.1 TRAP transporter small permease [Roseovarius sp.]
MAVASAVHEDGSLFSKLDRMLVVLERFLALLSGIAAFSLMFLAAWSVSSRTFFGAPLLGYVDLIEMLMPLIAIMGVAYVQRGGGHVRMDILIGRLGGRALWAVELITVMLIFILMLALLWGSWSHFDRSFDFAKPLWSRDSTIDISLPIWPSKLIVPVAFFVLSIRLALQIWGYGRAFALNLERPPGVPVKLSVNEQAKAEAHSLGGRD